MNAIIEYFSGFYGRLELLATILLIINVWMLARQQIWNYVFGAVGVLIYGYIFFAFKLYSDMLLQWLYFLPLQFVGFWYWKTQGPGDDNLPVQTISNFARLNWIGAMGIATGVLGYVMATYTDASFPYWDALTTVMSVVANYLLIKKIWENWVIWVAMDVIAINIYYQKELYVTSGLYVVFLGLATYGLLEWYRKIGRDKDGIERAVNV